MVERVRTGVPGLDELLCGGFIAGSAVLLQGAPGTGKSTLGLQFLYNGIVHDDEPGLLITFEEFPYILLRDAQSHGWDLRKLEEANKLRIIFTSPQVLISSLQLPTSPLNRTIMEWGVRRIVLDSASHFAQITRDPVELRAIYNMVINGLKREGLTSLLTSETTTGQLRPERHDLAYVVDAVLMTRYIEVDSAMERAIMVLKMRGSSHTHDIHRFEIGQDGVVIGMKFEGLQGLLTGMPSRTTGRR
jgi:circadian clock protein KaiC